MFEAVILILQVISLMIKEDIPYIELTYLLQVTVQT